MSNIKNRSSLLRRLAIAVSAIGFGQSAFVSLVPLVMERLRLDTFAVGAATAVGAAAFLVGSPLWGRMGERLGHARLLRLLGLAMLAGQAVFAMLLIARHGSRARHRFADALALRVRLRRIRRHADGAGLGQPLGCR